MIMHDDAYYESRVPIKDLGPWKNFLRFIWDGERRAFLDRTAKDWSVLGLFYLGFFGVLFSLFALQMWVALGFVGYLDKPYMQHSTRAIGKAAHRSSGRSFVQTAVIAFDNPGLGFIPNIFSPTTSPIIWVSDSNEKSKSEKYVRAITKFLDGYKRNESEYDTDCSEGRFRSEFTKKPCFFKTDVLGPCSVPPYGYNSPFQPCVLLKFNKRFDWVPIFYDQTSELPETMPYDLRKTVRASQEFRVWLSCTGASNFDKEHVGDIEYYPAPGFPVEFFPFMGQPEYLAPVVGLVFKNLTANVLVTVQCSVWAQNIGQERRYCLDFQIMIGNEKISGVQFYINPVNHINEWQKHAKFALELNLTFVCDAKNVDFYVAMKLYISRWPLPFRHDGELALECSMFALEFPSEWRLENEHCDVMNGYENFCLPLQE